MVDGAGAGGYCYHLNGGLSVLLEWLGFDVHAISGACRRTRPRNPEPIAGATVTIALTVTGSRAAVTTGAGWSTPASATPCTKPIPLVEGESCRGRSRSDVRPSSAEPGGWRFDHTRPARSASFDYRPVRSQIEELMERHTFLSTSPESGFVRVVTAQRRDSTGVDASAARSSRERRRPGWHPGADVRAGVGARSSAIVFGMSLAHLAATAITAVWRRICLDHEAFLRVAAARRGVDPQRSDLSTAILGGQWRQQPPAYRRPLRLRRE